MSDNWYRPTKDEYRCGHVGPDGAVCVLEQGHTANHAGTARAIPDSARMWLSAEPADPVSIEQRACGAMIPAPDEMPPWKECGNKQPCSEHPTSATDWRNTYAVSIANEDGRDELAERIFLALVTRDGLDDVKPDDLGDFSARQMRRAYTMADAVLFIRTEQPDRRADRRTT